MNRRDLVKQVLATAAVGAFAPKLLAEPVSFTTPWMAFEPGEAMYFLVDASGKIIESKPRSPGMTTFALTINNGRYYLTPRAKVE